MTLLPVSFWSLSRKGYFCCWCSHWIFRCSWNDFLLCFIPSVLSLAKRKEISHTLLVDIFEMAQESLILSTWLSLESLDASWARQVRNPETANKSEHDCTSLNVIQLDLWKGDIKDSIDCTFISLKKDPLRQQSSSAIAFPNPEQSPGLGLSFAVGGKFCRWVVRHRLQISACVSNNSLKLQRNALAAADDGVLGGECRDRDISHSPQSLTPVNVELSYSCTVKAKIQAQNWVTTALPVSVCALSPGKMQGKLL